MSIVLSIDAMGGDRGPSVVIAACIKFLKTHHFVNLIIVGDENIIHKELGSNFTKFADRIEIIHTSELVSMDESPQSALRGKKDSSLRVAINQIKLKKADAIISSGNTGALMAIAKFVLGTINGIDRPAIAKFIPTQTGQVCMLDLGANLEAQPEQLLQFALMAAELIRNTTNNKNPTVGLLNIGSEDIKGSPNVKLANELLKQSSINYYGYVEGNDINKGTVDIVVCDGFTGNVVLKTIEGVAQLIATLLISAFKKSLFSKISAIVASPVLKKFKQSLDSRKYNGAILIGLNGLVIKSHGSADEFAFYYALDEAYKNANADLVDRLKTYFATQYNK
jgi:glycerol-3-phosphate acyltransferase PlsX